MATSTLDRISADTPRLRVVPHTEWGMGAHAEELPCDVRERIIEEYKLSLRKRIEMYAKAHYWKRLAIVELELCAYDCGFEDGGVWEVVHCPYNGEIHEVEDVRHVDGGFVTRVEPSRLLRQLGAPRSRDRGYFSAMRCAATNNTSWLRKFEAWKDYHGYETLMMVHVGGSSTMPLLEALRKVCWHAQR